ncbi:MAG: DUF1292 domain-containing protein [Clostridia bacterium]|nr:DUF1292 domain-containing protein [Clostridia bacterium]
MDDNKMILEFDDGVTVEAEILGLFDVKGKDYIALQDKTDGEYYLYRYIQQGEGFEMKDIPDYDYEMVENAFNKIMQGDK